MYGREDDNLDEYYGDGDFCRSDKAGELCGCDDCYSYNNFIQEEPEAIFSSILDDFVKNLGYVRTPGMHMEQYVCAVFSDVECHLPNVLVIYTINVLSRCEGVVRYIHTRTYDLGRMPLEDVEYQGTLAKKQIEARKHGTR